MGSKTNTFENQFLRLIFNNIATSNIGLSGASLSNSQVGNLELRLCTTATICDEATIGTEASYGGYSRASVPRSTAGWTVTDNSVTNTASIVFGTHTGGDSQEIGYIEIWKYPGASGVDNRLFWGAFDPSITVSVGNSPTFSPGMIIINED